ncbi:hypothetical protein [Muricoccus vinaceus]|uniref:Uncharacterized protein n=1 Tax=Muricoccus vinaceus TaxID=424704 RepID=A0ABV6IZV6_9PROT
MRSDPPFDPETGEILDAPPVVEAQGTRPVQPPAPSLPPTIEAAPLKPGAEAPEDAAAPDASAGEAGPASKQPAEKAGKARVPRARPPANADELGEAVKEAQAQLAEAGSTGAFARDPYRLALAGLSATIGVLPRFARRVEGSFSGVVGELTELVRAMRHPLTEAERAILTREVVSTIDRAAKESLGSASLALPRAIDRRSLALVAATLSVSLAVVGGSAFFAGRWSATGEARAWVASQRADISLGAETLASLPVAEAQAWSQLIKANPAIREALSKARDRGSDPAGRPYGAVPLWLALARTPPIGR